MSREEGNDRYGTVYKLEDGRLSVRFERALVCSVDRVWAVLTDREQRDKWMPGVRFEPGKGGGFEIWFGGNCDGPAHVSGTVEAYDPPNVLQLNTMRWELREAASGCRLIFTDVLVFQGGRSDAEITDAVLGGWHNYLDMLEDAVSGRPVDANQPEPDYSSREVANRPV